MDGLVFGIGFALILHRFAINDFVREPENLANESFHCSISEQL